MGRRIIICDGAESARLWSRIGADLSEELTWVPREGEGRSRPPGFRILQGGLDEGAIAKLEPQPDDEYALVSDDGPWTRLAVREIRKLDEEASILVLSDALTQEDLPDHPSLRRTGWKTLIRDDINEEFDHLANLHRVAKLRRLLDQREKIAILLQPDPDPDGIASAYGLRTILGRKRTTAPIVSFGEVQRPENQALCEAVGIDVKVVSPDDIKDYDGLVLVDVQPNVFGDDAPARLSKVDLVIDHHPERSGYEATIRDIRTSYGATSSIVTEYLRATGGELNAKLATALLYGIKSDTQYLGRETSRRDMQSFAFLHASHSPALLRLDFGVFVLHAVQLAMWVAVPAMLVQAGLAKDLHWQVYLPAVLGSFIVMGMTLFRLEKKGYLRAVFLVAVGLIALVQLGLLWVASGPPGIGALAALLFVFFCGFNVLEASQPSLASRVAPAHARGAALGVYNTLQSLGFFAGGLAGGALVKHVGPQGLFAVCALAMAVWLVLAWPMTAPAKPAAARDAQAA